MCLAIDNDFVDLTLDLKGVISIRFDYDYD